MRRELEKAQLMRLQSIAEQQAATQQQHAEEMAALLKRLEAQTAELRTLKRRRSERRAAHLSTDDLGGSPFASPFTSHTDHNGTQAPLSPLMQVSARNVSSLSHGFAPPNPRSADPHAAPLSESSAGPPPLVPTSSHPHCRIVR